MTLAATMARLDRLSEADFERVAALAHSIWHRHYGAMITAAQIDYMLAARFAPDNLRRYLGAADRGFDVLSEEGRQVGYCSYALTGASRELKLEQLYLLPECHGLGLGGLMIRHVERRARELGCDRLMLQVAKANAGSVAIYERSGFRIREEVVFDIGEGHVMDDYVMEKRLR